MTPCCERFEDQKAESRWWDGSIRENSDGEPCIAETVDDEAGDGSIVTHATLVPIDYCPFCGAEVER